MSIEIKSRLKSYSFWVSLASAILLLVQTVGRPLGLVIDETTYMSIINSVLGVFVVLGIISHPGQTLINNANATSAGSEVEANSQNQKTKNESVTNDTLSNSKTTQNATSGSSNLTNISMEDSKSNSKISSTDDNTDENCEVIESMNNYTNSNNLNLNNNDKFEMNNYSLDSGNNVVEIETDVDTQKRLDNFRQQLDNIYKN